MDRRTMFARAFVATVATIAALTVTLAACGNDDAAPASNVPTINPDPLLTEQEAIEIAKDQHEELLESINFYGHSQVKIRTGSMLLRDLQELTGAELFTTDSPRLNRQIWAVQIGGNFGDHDVPYNIRNGYGIVGIDAANGDIWLRARYNREILVNPGE